MLTHTYDEIGRRTRTDINDAAWFLPPPPNQPDTSPPNRPTLVDYGYDDDGSLARVTAWGNGANGVVVQLAENRFEYDERHNLTADQQAHAGAVDSSTPTTGYQWDFSPAPNTEHPDGLNHDRLASISYPLAQAGQARAVSFQYTDTADDPLGQLGRIRRISWTGVEPLATYAYGGTSRRVGAAWGNNVVTQSFAGGAGYSGLDRFGRIRDLLFEQPGGSPATIHRYEYSYDQGGNRTGARVTQRPYGNVNHENDRSYAYTYDGLNRLIDSAMGRLDFHADGTPYIVSPEGGNGAPIPRTAAWNLDYLGNWSGSPADLASVVRTGDFNNDQISERLSLHHAVNQANEIDRVYENGQSTAFVTDLAGNLTYDGQYVYQYDAWNRLIQVNLPGTVTFSTEGRITGGKWGTWSAGMATTASGGWPARRRRSTPATRTCKPRTSTMTAFGGYRSGSPVRWRSS